MTIGTENMYTCDGQRGRLQGMPLTYCTMKRRSNLLSISGFQLVESVWNNFRQAAFSTAGAAIFSPFHLFTLSPFHPFTFSSFHLFTFSPFHLFTFSPFHLFTLFTFSPFHSLTFSSFNLLFPQQPKKFLGALVEIGWGGKREVGRGRSRGGGLEYKLLVPLFGGVDVLF